MPLHGPDDVVVIDWLVLQQLLDVVQVGLQLDYEVVVDVEGLG